MRILKYKNKLVEEVGYANGEKVVFLEYIKDEDKNKCECGRPIEKQIAIVENSPQWQSEITGVDTIKALQDNK